MTALAPTGFLRIGASDLEYRMIGPDADDAPSIVMLHEGLGSVALWGDFPDRLQAATGAGVLVYSRAGYGNSTPAGLPRPLDYMHIEALEILPQLLEEIGFRRGLLLGHSDGASIAAIYAGGVQDHRIRGVAMIAPHFVVEDISVKSIAEIKEAYQTTKLPLPQWAYVPGETAEAEADHDTLWQAMALVPSRFQDFVPARHQAVWAAAPQGGRERILLRACIQSPTPISGFGCKSRVRRR